MAATTVTQFRCALYARVSTKDKGQEVENELRRLRELRMKPAHAEADYMSVQAAFGQNYLPILSQTRPHIGPRRRLCSEAVSINS